MLKSAHAGGTENVRNADDRTLLSGKVVPFYDVDAAAGTAYGVNMEPVSKPKEYIEIGGFLKESEEAIRVYGNSMTPNYPSGCIIGVKRHYDNFIVPGDVYVVETNSDRYFKRLYYSQSKSSLVCHSDNHMLHESGARSGTPFYPEFEIPVDDIKKIFKVVGVIKRNIL